MACCLTASCHCLSKRWLIITAHHCHCLNKRWLIINWSSLRFVGIYWKFTENAQDLSPWCEFENYWFKMLATFPMGRWVNILRPRQNGRHFADDIFKCISLNENVWIPIKVSLKFVPQGPINKIPALVQIMAWRLPGDKPLSEAMMVNLLTHICVTRPQWVKDVHGQFLCTTIHASQSCIITMTS